MAKRILKYTEWCGGSGFWYCNDVTELAGPGSQWWAPARMLGITPAAYVQFIIDNYKPDRILWNGKFLSYSWTKEHYSLCHSFVLYINKESRKRKFMV